jgi:hypothetical protein
MAPVARNERRPRIVPREWKILRAVTRAAAPSDEAQLKLRIGELEEMIVGAEEKEARRRAAGLLPTERAPTPGALPLRYAEKKELQNQRLKGWLGIAVLGLLLILAAAWFCFRLLVVL